MAKINNKEIYKLEELPDLLDFLIGSKEVGGTTKNFSLLSIVNLINGVNGKNGIQYLFSDGSDPAVDFNTPGYFFTDTNQTTVGSFSEFIFNKKNLANYDLTALFTFLGQRNDIVLKIENPSSPSDFFFFEIGGFEDHANYIVFYVTGYANLYLGQLEDFTAYSMYWDVQQDISIKADTTYVNAQDGITLAAAKAYTDTQDLLKENTSNKTSTLSGKEGSNAWFPSANGITAWIKNFLSNWVGAHATEIRDADTVLIGKSGVLGTRTWLQLKTLLLESVDLSTKLDKGTYTGTAQSLKADIDNLFIPDTVIRTTEPTRVGNEFTFPVDGYEVLLNKTRRSNVSVFITTIATATDDYKRTDLIYFKPNNTLAKVQGTEDLSLTKIPDVPAGGIGILYIDVYGSTIETPTVVKEKLSDFIDDIGAIDLEEVKVIDKSQIVNKILDVTKKYSIRKNLSLLASESIWMDNSPLIEGMGADFITIETTEPNSKIFTATNCKNFNLKNIALSPKGLGSKAFELKDGTGMHEFRLVGVNFLAAENAGTIDGFRQWYCTDIGFYNNCKNGFELKGTVNGILFTEMNIIGFASTGKLFRQGAGLVINDRAIIQINFSVPTGFVFMDFMPAVFTDNEALQIVDCVAKVNGVKNDINTATLFPNLSPNDPKCLWSNNAGIANTAIEKIIINPTVASTFVINWLNDSYDITLTANTTFTESNLPATGRRTKTINITIVGNYTPTFPAAWELNKIGTFKKGDLNSITVKFISAGKYAMRIDNSLTVYPKPNLSSLSPNSMLPNTTIQLDIYGSFFTPESFVEVGNLTINNTVFVDSGHLKVFLTSNEIEKPYNVLISNGTTVVYLEAFSVVLGTVYVPEISNFVNGNGLFDKSIGRLAIQTYDLQVASVELDYIVGGAQNFQVEFSLHHSDLAPHFAGFTRNLYILEILDKANNEVLYGMQMYSSNDWKVISNKTGTQFGSFWSNPLGLPIGQSAFSPVKRLKFRRINNIMTFLIDNAVLGNFQVSDAGINNNKSLFFRFNSKVVDIKNIKYIELTN